MEVGEVARVRAEVLHDLQHIDSIEWAIDVHGGRTMAYVLVMAARQTLVERLAELEAT